MVMRLFSRLCRSPDNRQVQAQESLRVGCLARELWCECSSATYGALPEQGSGFAQVSGRGGVCGFCFLFANGEQWRRFQCHYIVKVRFAQTIFGRREWKIPLHVKIPEGEVLLTAHEIIQF